jgi:hypothetical protein
MIAFKTFLVAFALMQDIPLKPSNEFQVTVDIQFKSRPASEVTYDANGNKFENNTGLLTFLAVNLSSIVTSNGEARFKAIDGSGKILGSKKIAPNVSYHFDMGFVADLKKQENNSNRITVYFLNDKRVEISKVEMEVTKDGDFLVNGEKRGQF